MTREHSPEVEEALAFVRDSFPGSSIMAITQSSCRITLEGGAQVFGWGGTVLDAIMDAHRQAQAGPVKTDMRCPPPVKVIDQ